MNNKINNECRCILEFFNGSWIMGVKLTTEQQQQVVKSYLEGYSQEELNKIVIHVESDFSLSTLP